MMEQENNLNNRHKTDWKNRIIWILLVTVFWYMFVFSIIGDYLFDNELLLMLVDEIGYMSDAMKFTVIYYLVTIVSFVGIFVFAAVTKRNRFILRSFLPSAPCNKMSLLLKGLLLGFIMNGGCILLALLCGDIKLFWNFTMNQIPLYLFALVCVFIQSASEELWCRGFMYERINVHYPLWVAILVNGVFFGLMHMFNSGVTALSIIGIAVCGLSYSIAKWYTGSIWFVAGIHTGWNFTQNYLFGLPNSGLVSEASVFGLDAATARSSWAYDVAFGIEGGYPSVIGDCLLGVICLILLARAGRLGELKQRQVTPGRDPQGPQPLGD